MYNYVHVVSVLVTIMKAVIICTPRYWMYYCIENCHSYEI